MPDGVGSYPTRESDSTSGSQDIKCRATKISTTFRHLISLARLSKSPPIRGGNQGIEPLAWD